MIGGSGANGSVGPPAATAFSVHQQLTEANRLFQQSSYQAAAAGVVSPFSGHIPSHHGPAAAALQQHHHHQQQHAAAAAVAAGQHQTQQQQHNAAAVAAAAVAAMGQSSHSNLSQLTHGLSNASQSLAAFFATAPLLPDNLKLAAAAAAAAAAAQSSRSKKCHRAEPLPQSGFKGVSWNSRMKAWLAFYVTENGERKSKTFSTRKLGMEEARVQAISFCKQKQDQRRERKRTRELQQQQQSQQQHCSNSDVGSISGDNAGASSPSQQAAAAAAAAVAAMRCGYSTTPALNNGNNVGASSSSMAPLLGQGGAGSGNRDGIMSNQGAQSSSMASSGGPEIAYVPIVPIAMHMIQKSGLLQPLELNELPPCQHCNKQPYPFLMIVSEGQEQTYSSSSIISLSSTTVSPSAASSSSAHGRPESCTRESADGLTGQATSDRLSGTGAGVGSGLIGSPGSGNPTPSTCDSGTPHSTSNSAGSILGPMSETPTRGDVSTNGTTRVLHHGGSSLAVNRSSRQQNHCLLPSPTGGGAQQQPVTSRSGASLSPHTAVSPRSVILLNNGQAGHGEKGEQRQQQRLNSEMSLESGAMNHRKEDVEPGGTETRGQALCRMTGTGSYMPGNGLHAASVLSTSQQQHHVAVKEADEAAYCDPTMVINFSADQHDPQQQQHHHQHHHHMVNNGSGSGGVPGTTKGGHLNYSSASQCISSDSSSHPQRGAGNTLPSSEASGPYAQHQQYLRDSLLRNELDEGLSPSVSANVPGLTMARPSHHGGSGGGLSLYETSGAATPRAPNSSSINQHSSTQSQGCDVASGIDDTVDIAGGLPSALGNSRDTSGHCGDARNETAKNGAPLFLHGSQYGQRHHHHGSSGPGPVSSSSSSAMDRGSVNPVPPNPGGYHHLRLETHQPAPSHAHHLCDTTANSQTSGPESIDLHGPVIGLLHHKRHQPHHPHHSHGGSSHLASSTSLAQHLQQGHHQHSNMPSSISFLGGHHSGSGNKTGDGSSSVGSEASGPLPVMVPHERPHGSSVSAVCHGHTHTLLGEGNASAAAPALSPLQTTSCSLMSSPSSSSGAAMTSHVYPDASASSSPLLPSQQQQQNEVLRSQHLPSQSQAHHQQQVPSSSAVASPCCYHTPLQQNVHHGGVYSPHHQAMPVVSGSSPSPSPSLLSPEDCALGANPGPTIEQGRTLLHSAPSSPIRETQPVSLFSPATVGEPFSNDTGAELTGKKKTHLIVAHETPLVVTAEANSNGHAPPFKRTSTGDSGRLLEYPNLDAPLSVSLLSLSSTSSSVVGGSTSRIVSSPSSTTLLSSSTCHGRGTSMASPSVSGLSQQAENQLSVSSGLFSSGPLDTTCPVDMGYVCGGASTEPTPLLRLKSEPSCSIPSSNSKEALNCSFLRGSGRQPSEEGGSPSMSSPLMVTLSESPSSYRHQTCLSVNATRFIAAGGCESFSSTSAEPELLTSAALVGHEESAKKGHLNQLHSHHRHHSVHNKSSTTLRSNPEGALTTGDTTATASFGEILNTTGTSQTSLSRPPSHSGVERTPTPCSFFGAQDTGAMEGLHHGIGGSQRTHVDENMPGELKAET